MIMKELTIEQKAQRYDEAISMAKKFCTPDSNNTNLKATLEMIFPELKESKDERIRKQLIVLVKSSLAHTDEEINEMIAWLEKQGDIDRRIQEEIEKQTKQLWKAEKQCEPKFRVGDVMRTWQEAFNGIIDGLPVVVAIDDENYRCNNEIISITDQEDYEYPPMNRKQNFAWSEEDEKMIDSSVDNLTELMHRYGEKYGNVGKCIDWLKSIRHQNRWKPSDEQMEAVKRASNGSRAIAGKDYLIMESLYNDLEKLTE